MKSFSGLVFLSPKAIFYNCDNIDTECLHAFLLNLSPMKTSGIVAKAVSRLFLILVLLAAVFLFKDDSTKLQHLYIVTKSKWMFVFPVILIGGFVFFFIRCTIKRYTEPDSNWLLVINTLVLMAYSITLFLRLYELAIKH